MASHSTKYSSVLKTETARPFYAWHPSHITIFHLKMEAIGSSETVIYETTWHHIPEDSNLNTTENKNLKSQIKYTGPCQV
jgi:hypothetical protein